MSRRSVVDTAWEDANTYQPISPPQPPGIGKTGIILGAGVVALVLLAATVLSTPQAPAERSSASKQAGIHVLLRPHSARRREDDGDEVTVRDVSVQDSGQLAGAVGSTTTITTTTTTASTTTTTASTTTTTHSTTTTTRSTTTTTHSTTATSDSRTTTDRSATSTTRSTTTTTLSTTTTTQSTTTEGASTTTTGEEEDRDRRQRSNHTAPKLVKGAAFKVRLVEGTAQGCCSWDGKCDNGQEFCNGNVSVCKKCGGTWLAKYGPAHFGGDPDAWCSAGCMDSWRLPAMTRYLPAAASAVELKVLTYNLQWWRVYKKLGGMGGKEGHLIRDTGPYDLIGLQECDDPWRVLWDAGLDKDYMAFGGKGEQFLAVCAAFRKAAWEELGRGSSFVAEDGAGKYNYYGKRVAIWFRLRHHATGETLLFVVHHGPLPLSSGGRCGGHATGFNLLKLIAENSREGDAVVLVGDFNAKAGSLTVQTLESELTRVYSGVCFGGIDHVFTNLGPHRSLGGHNHGTGGSDHDALSVALKLGGPAVVEVKT